MYSHCLAVQGANVSWVALWHGDGALGMAWDNARHCWAVGSFDIGVTGHLGGFQGMGLCPV